MKLNSYELYRYDVHNDTAVFLVGCGMSEAISLQGQDLVINDGESDIAVYSGYTLTRIEKDPSLCEIERTYIYAERKLDDTTKDVISGLEKSLALMIDASNRNEEFQNGVEDQISRYKNALPSIFMRADLTDAEALSCSEMYPEWTIGFSYKKDWIISFENQLYRIGQDHTSQEQWKPGETGTESLYSAISFSGDYEVWKEWDGISGSYAINQIVKDPNDGKLYKSKIPNNVWGPPSTQPDYWEEYTA